MHSGVRELKSCFRDKEARARIIKGENQMAIGKKTTKKTAAKVAVKKPVAVKPVAPKAVKKTATKRPVVSQGRFYAMVSEAAYFAAQNDNNQKGAVAYWMDAEAAIRAKFDVV